MQFENAIYELFQQDKIWKWLAYPMKFKHAENRIKAILCIKWSINSVYRNREEWTIKSNA